MPGYLQEANGAATANGDGKCAPRKAVNVPALQKMKAEGIPIAALTAYDFTMAQQMDRAGVDLALVGDSLGTVVQGQPSTLPVTVDEVLYHTKCVRRALNSALLVADLPFASMHSVEAVVQASVRLLAEGGAAMVKLEMGGPGAPLHLEMVRALTQRSIPVCAHLGLTPQSVNQIGGYRVQGKDKSARPADQLLADAVAAERAGASLVVLECVPGELAKQVTQALAIPTIGIGAGVHCDGQILVMHDLLGAMERDVAPKFVKNFLKGRDSILEAFRAYVGEVRERKFPAEEHSYH